MSLTASLWRTCLIDLNLSSIALIVGVLATPVAVVMDVLHAPFVGLAWTIRQFRQGETAWGAFGISVIGSVSFVVALALSLVDEKGWPFWLGIGLMGVGGACFIAWGTLFVRAMLHEAPP